MTNDSPVIEVATCRFATAANRCDKDWQERSDNKRHLPVHARQRIARWHDSAHLRVWAENGWEPICCSLEIAVRRPASAGRAELAVDGDNVIAGPAVRPSKGQQALIIANKLGAHGKLPDDFIDLRHFADFNVADSCLTCGVVLDSLLSLRGIPMTDDAGAGVPDPRPIGH